MRRNGIRWMGWWYCAIAVGFMLLAANHIVTRDRPWLIGVRLVIALGFAWLAFMEFSKPKRRE
ncbi:MAG: hypothetical protein WB992_13060 [Bryobacteraceae bacterium]